MRGQVVEHNGWVFSVAAFCPACGSQQIQQPGWFVGGDMLMTECTDCGCHFGTAGRWSPDEGCDCDDRNCAHHTMPEGE